MFYLKIDQNKIVEAPYTIERNGKVIYGYNKPNNEAMLFEDGYAKFPKSADNYEIKNGQIVEKEPTPYVKNIFTKLEIRRAMRQLGIEDQLNTILNENPQFKIDWDDAQEINLNDPLIQNAIKEGIISQELIERLREIL